MKKNTTTSGYGFGTFQGVFTPSILTIIGVVMYLRFGWMLGNVGLATSLIIVTMGSLITFLTGLSISALATNMRVKCGGAYFILSRSLGPEAGAAFGLPLAFSQAIAVSFYVAGFAEALVQSNMPFVSGLDLRLVSLATLVAIVVVSVLSADIALKSQYVIMAAIVLSLVSFFLGSTPANMGELSAAAHAAAPAKVDFWIVFSVFFPAVTGILSGLGMSGDLKAPAKSIPRGTLAAVAVGWAIYMALPIALDAFVGDQELLRHDTMILGECAKWKTPILLGVLAATLSSAVGSFLVAPRVFQALARDNLAPRVFAKGFSKTDEPRYASIFVFIVAAISVYFGDINILAPVLTLFNLSTYGLLNFSAAMEEMMANPSWRPSFRVKAYLSILGFLGCLAIMFMISPGWTLVALIVEGGIFYIAKSRSLKARWGDMRTGVFASMVRFALRRINEKSAYLERNWRPNFLVMLRLPVQSYRMLELVREISSGRSLVTLASVIPESATSKSLPNEIKDSVLRMAEKIRLEAEVKILPMQDPWQAMLELVRCYGFGPITPNTIVFGFPEVAHSSSFAALFKEIAGYGRNLIIVGDQPEPAMADSDKPYIDIWWRGANENGGLMLALAFLLARGEKWRDKELRINTIIHRRTPEEVRAILENFLREARVKAKIRIIESSESEYFLDSIVKNSGESALTLMGLRAPAESESAASWAAYFEIMREGASKLASPVFVLAAENLDFKKIFMQ